jgi:tetratricopeptide (TPR) repeat protein
MSTEAARATLQAELALQTGDMLAAVEAWRLAVRADELSAYLQLRLGEALLLVGDADGAGHAGGIALRLADETDPRSDHAIAALCLLGQAMVELGRLDDAEGHLREALRRVPGEPRASALLANQLVARGSLDEAEAIVQRWTEQDPGTTGLVSLARVFAERGQLERAHRHLDAALGRVAADEAALGLKRDLLLAEGRDDDAVAVARGLLAARGDGPETRSGLLVTTALAQPDEARRVAAGLLAEEPGERTRLLIADAFERAGLVDDAAATLREAVAAGATMRPSSVVFLELARLELARRDPSAAQRIACRAADVVDPTDARLADWAVALCARAEVDLGRTAPAVSRLVARVAVRPPRARPLQALATLLPLVEDSAVLDVARSAAREVLALQGDPTIVGAGLEPAIVLQAAQVLEAGGDHDGARVAVEALLTTRPADRDVILGHARLLDVQGRSDAQTLAAVELVERLVDRVGGDIDTLNFMAFALAERGLRPDDAKAFAWRAVLLDPLSGYVLDTLGWAQLKAGDVDAALRTLRRADRLAPREGEIWFHIAAAERARGDVEAAHAAVARALELLPSTDPLRARATALMSEP